MAAYKERGVLIDANLLLLYLVGSYDIDLVEKFKRTKMFTRADFRIIWNIMEYFNKIVTTPNILTETSNLAGQLPERSMSPFLENFKRRLHILEEEYHPSASASSHKFFSRTGLTDAVIMTAAANKYLVITDDLRLSSMLESLRIDVINLNHIRMFD